MTVKAEQLIYPAVTSAILALIFAWRAFVYRARDNEPAVKKSTGAAVLCAFISGICFFLIVELHLPMGVRSCMPSYASRIC